MTPRDPKYRRGTLGDTDSDWELLGKTDPYWAVVTFDRFRRANLDSDNLREFFERGEREVAHMFKVIRTHLEPDFAPSSALDFGCGVGRMVVPLATRCASVVGVDVSESMLREARANCDQRELGNVTFLRSDDDLSAVSEGFDLVTTFIVLQHIPCIRGSRIFGRLVDVLNDGGVGVIHVTYSNQQMDAALENTHAAWPTPNGLRHHLRGLRRAARRRLEGLVSGRRTPRKRRESPRAEAAPMATPTPVMQMNPYALNPLFHVLQQAGVRSTYVEFTDHGGVFGVVLYLKKQPGAPYQL